MATIAETITEVRRLLQDTIAPYRFEDTRLYWALNVALKSTLLVRPDLFISTSFAVSEYSTADSGTTLPIEDMYMPAVVNFAVGYTGLADDEFTVDGRASALLRAFQAQMLGI